MNKSHSENSKVASGGDEHHEPPVKLVGVIVAHPVMSCCCFGGCFFLFFFMTVVMLAAGVSVISFDRVGEVGLDQYEHVYFRRWQALEVGKKVANFTSGDICERQSLYDYPVTLIMKNMRGENLLTTDALSDFKAVIETFTQHDEWSDYCALSYSDTDSCAVAPLLNVDGGEVDGATQTYDMTNADGCWEPNSPMYFFERYGDSDFNDVENVLDAIMANSADSNAMLRLLSRRYTNENHFSDVLKATIFYGLPRPNATTDAQVGDYADLQDPLTGNGLEVDENEVFIYVDSNFLDYLEGEGEKWTRRVLYSYPGMNPIGDQVLIDLSLLMVSILFVFCYMWYNLRSFWLTTCGLGMIFGSFFGANLIYRFMWPNADGFGYEFFSLFIVLSLFIIMGIGADDIFVFMDTFNESDPADYPNLAHRLSHTYRHAGKAMLITSLTTAMSFFTNVSSPFLGIRTFGIYSGLLVCVNYVGVITLFPTVVVLYQTYWKKKPFLGCLSCVPFCQPKGEDGGAGAGTPMGADEINAEPTEELQKTEVKEDKIVAFFRDKYAPFLIKYKLFVLIGFSIFLVIFVVFAAQIKAVPFEFRTMVKTGYNFRDYLDAVKFDLPDNTAPMEARVVWGLDVNNPIDYGDMKAYEFILAESGEPQWDRSFEVEDSKTQIGMVDACETLATSLPASAKVDTDYGVNPDVSGAEGIPVDYTTWGTQCMMQAIKEFERGSVSYDADENLFTGPTVDGWSSVTRPGSYVPPCYNCFSEMKVNPAPDADGEWEVDDVSHLLIYNTSAINEGCSCIGSFPVPESICFNELDYLTGDTGLSYTRFKCIPGQYFYEDVSMFFSDMGAYNQWKPNAWATRVIRDGVATDEGERLAMVVVTVQLTEKADMLDYEVGLPLYEAWDAWAASYNAEARDSGLPEVMVVFDNAQFWQLSKDLFNSAISNIFLGLFLAFIVLVFATHNYIMAALATLNILAVVTCILGFVVMMDWNLGPIESLMTVLIVGFSVDYTVHLADSYMESKRKTREGRVHDALTKTGVSVLSGAVSTLGAAFPMLFAVITFFSKFGGFMFATILLSLLFSLGFFAAILMYVGPMGHEGSLAMLYLPRLEAAYNKALVETAEEERMLRPSAADDVPGGAL